MLARPELLVLAIVVGLSAATASILIALPDRDASVRPGSVWAFVVVVVLFGVFEYKVFNVEFRQEGIAYTLSEVPLGVALVFLAPIPAIVARLVLAVPVLVVFRLNRGMKLVFNACLFTFEVAFAFLLHRTLTGLWGDNETGVLVALVIVLAVTPVTTSIIISAAIACYEGHLRERVASELGASWWIHPVASVIPVMTVAMALVEPWLALLAGVPVAGMWYVLNTFGRQQQALRDLDTLHGFVGRIGGSLDVTEIAELAVEEIGTHIRSAGVAIVRFGADGPVVVRRGFVPLDLPSTPDDERWVRLLDQPAGQVVSGSELHDVWRGPGDPSPVLLARLRDGGETFGLVVALQRALVGTEFGDGDARRFQSIAEQLAVSLRRGMLHEQLEYEARHDALTDLPARTLFERYVADALGRLDEGKWAVMMLDLDRFKEVNDTLGHHAGDTLLVEFSRRMSKLLGEHDHLARLAGDEFAILCRCPDRDGIREVAASCVREGGRPVAIDGLEIVVTVSVGVAEITSNDVDALQPMRRADIAMYNAKWQRTGFELYRDEIDRRTPARLSMLGDLRAAIETDELDVVYQPKLDLATGDVVGVEALVRWEHQQRGIVAPTEFVRVAEDTGLIKELTDLVLARGIADLREFQRLGLGLAVNLSTHDLFDARLPDRVRTYLDANDVAPDLLTLEITESTLLIDAPRTRATIDDLHAVGIRLAVDDFGTGYSSLSYLRRLPVQELKIDQSFVSGMLDDPQDEVIVRSTVDLGHNLGLRVVAEGVERRAVLERLRVMGCDVAQGYGISRPLTRDQLAGWVAGVRAHAGEPMDWVAVQA